MSDEEAKRIEQQNAESAAKHAKQMDENITAEIRKTLADALKAVTQADKNAAAASAEQVNTVLDTLERGSASGKEDTPAPVAKK